MTWLILRVLPLLAPVGAGARPRRVLAARLSSGMAAERRDWNESYFLLAFLSGNPSWEILLWNSWLWQARPEVIPRRLASGEPGSIWLRKIA